MARPGNVLSAVMYIRVIYRMTLSVQSVNSRQAYSKEYTVIRKRIICDHRRQQSRSSIIAAPASSYSLSFVYCEHSVHLLNALIFHCLRGVKVTLARHVHRAMPKAALNLLNRSDCGHSGVCQRRRDEHDALVGIRHRWQHEQLCHSWLCACIQLQLTAPVSYRCIRGKQCQTVYRGRVEDCRALRFSQRSMGSGEHPVV